MSGLGHAVTLYRPEYVREVVEYCAQGYSLTAFAGKVGVCRDTVLEWCNRHPEFKQAVAFAKANRARWWEEQAVRVTVEGGTSAQSTLISFGLKNHAPEEFKDKQEIEHSGNIGFAERLLAARERRKDPEE